MYIPMKAVHIFIISTSIFGLINGFDEGTLSDYSNSTLTNETVIKNNETDICAKLQPLLMKIGDACRCFDIEEAIADDEEQLTGDGEKMPWLGCTRERMPLIFKSLNSLPNDTRLTKIWIWDSLIPLLPPAFFGKVRADKLILENNHLGEFSFQVLTPTARYLKHLVLRNNIMKETNQRMFAALSKLTTLDLSGNLLTDVNENSFGEIGTLRVLSLYNNKLHRLGDDAFSKLSKLKHLNLASNELPSIDAGAFRGLDELESLNLESNKIGNVANGAFDHLKKLKALNLGGNVLMSVTLPSSLVHLKTLSLNNNAFPTLKDLRLDTLPNLEIIHLDKNKLTSIDVDDGLARFPNLRVLSATSNEIANLDADAFIGLANLSILSLQNNKIAQLSKRLFVATPQLKQLFLSQNLLSDIDDYTFVGLSYLNVLSLAHNRISNVGPNALTGLIALERLYLNDNILQLLEENATSPFVKSMYAVDLSDNLWICDCSSLHLVKRFGLERASIVVNGENTRCQSNGRPFAVAWRDLEENCLGGFGTRNGTFDGDASLATTAWVTAVGCILGVVSVLLLMTVMVLYYQDVARWTKFMSVDQRHFMKRVPSDMVNLIPKELTITEKT